MVTEAWANEVDKDAYGGVNVHIYTTHPIGVGPVMWRGETASVTSG